MNGKAGAGIYGHSPRVKISLSLGQYATVYQAEIAAITACVRENLTRGYSNKHIYICSDSQAALKALSKAEVRSAITLECKNALDRLSLSNKVSLIWMPGHTGIEGNEEADNLAREGSKMTFIGPEPVFGIAQSTAKTFIRKWITSEFREEWNQQERLRQSRTFILDPMDRSEVKRLLSSNRNQLRAFVGVLTGHSLVNYHLYNIGLSNEPDCRFCGGEDETTEHLTCRCDALVNSRHHHLGDRFLEPEDIRQIHPVRILSFLRRIGLTE